MAERRPLFHDPTRMPVLQLRDWLASGAISAVEVADAFLAVVAAKEPQLEAWAFIDPDLVRRQAAERDAHRKAGRPLGPLHGIPVGLKDLIDTADMPTENGTVLDAGRRPQRDAQIVARLKAAGAVIMGKTAMTELAYFSPCRTRNPHDPERTPGGSSSGSAAAVAAGMVPLAVGTQTMGSVIRPASFCGVHGFKPSHGLIGRSGLLLLSRTLDTVGVFARELEGVALLADALEGHDGDDPDTMPRAPSRLLEHAQARPPVPPLFAFYRTPVWDEAEEATHAAFAELTEALGGRCDLIDPGPMFAEGYAAHRTVMATEMARNLGRYLDRGADALSQPMRELLARGRATTAVDYLAASDWRPVLNAGLERVFERYDAIITPAAAGEAPVGLGSTGNPVFAALWTFLGLPAVTLPLLTGPNGMPVGVQLVGRRGEDGRLLRTAAALMRLLAEEDGAAEAGGAR
jgi:Asp-tRNA(Asn)/Glu-tRNA(Gln) amidotransferase A subunit family amidase